MSACHVRWEHGRSVAIVCKTLPALVMITAALVMRLCTGHVLKAVVQRWPWTSMDDREHVRRLMKQSRDIQIT